MRRGRVVGTEIPRFKHKWFGILEVETQGKVLSLFMPGIIAQWFLTGEEVEVEPLKEPGENGVLTFNEYELSRIYEGERIKVWFPYEEVFEVPRLDPLSGKEIYTYKVRGREAVREGDFEGIAELEQYHYASHKEVVARWRCEGCGYIISSNTKPICPNCKGAEKVHLFEIKDSTPSSRFLILELLSREEYEPSVLGYVRVDPPIPRMNRRLPSGEFVRDIRKKVFPKDWFCPLFHFDEFLREKRDEMPFHKLYEEARWELFRTTDTAVSRISRVVIHPDYRSDGLGIAAVKVALRWIEERRIPEMKRKKELVETIAQMARFNPFFEKVGFKYMWDVGSRRPALYFPLSEKARDCIEKFLSEDIYARKHGGRLCVSRFGVVEPLKAPITFRDVSKFFESELDLEGLHPSLRNLLEDFGVASRRIQRKVLYGVNLMINPGDVVAVVGASGAGKTTFLRLILGRALGLEEERFLPSSGEILIPRNTKVSALIPGEFEPPFGDESILEHIYRKTGDEEVAVEILNRCGLSDAVLYRASFAELSTGQKERAKLASLLAEKPNLLLIDEFAAHLDPLMAMRVARKLSELVREAGITLILSTHRREVLKALSPDRIIQIGYRTVREHAPVQEGIRPPHHKGTQKTDKETL